MPESADERAASRPTAWLGRSALRKPRRVRFDDGHEWTCSFERGTLLDANSLIAEMPSGASARRSAAATLPDQTEPVGQERGRAVNRPGPDEPLGLILDGLSAFVLLSHIARREAVSSRRPQTSSVIERLRRSCCQANTDGHATTHQRVRPLPFRPVSSAPPDMACGLCNGRDETGNQAFSSPLPFQEPSSAI
jgi:hypothetical protein